MAQYFSPKVATSGLAFYLDAANLKSYARSGTSWNDMVGGVTSTLTNGPTYSNDAQGTFVFDGTNDYAGTGNVTLSYPTGYTVEVVVKYTSLTGAQGLFSFNDAANSKFINLYKASTQMRFETFSVQSILGSSTLSAGVWYHFAAVHNGTTAFLYMNGILDASGNLTTSTTTTAPIELGRYAGQTNGSIPLARFYTRPLTANEILQNFESTRGRFGI